MDLNKKIEALFDLRKLPQLMDIAGATSIDKKSLLVKLYDLQKAIYFLDAVLEEQFYVNKAALQDQWEAIYLALKQIGVEPNAIKQEVHEIEMYQQHELSMREGDYILHLPMEYFYFFKSCDVKLIRRLIYAKWPKLQEIIPIHEWKPFDLFTELQDDVEDVFEDVHLINGNRFLLSIRKMGMDKSIHIFKDFAREIHSTISETVKTPLCFEMTDRAYSEFMDVLYNQEKRIVENPGFLLTNRGNQAI